jgi:hypothetical protein
LIFKAPSEKAPDYVKAKGSIKVSELMAWLDGRETEWVNFEVKVSKAGKWYAAVDSWEPSKDQQYAEGVAQAKAAAQPVVEDFADDDIPF